MADGTIYIDTAIDDNAVEKEMSDTEKAIKKAEERLDKLIEKQIRFVETGGNIKSRAFEGMEYDIAQTSASLDALRVKYAGMQNTMSAKKVSRLRGAFKKLGTTLGNVGKKVLGIGKNAKTSHRSMMKMLATSLLMGLAFMALMAIINGLKEGINNLAQYSGDVNEDLSALKSSLTQLKNSFATAFTPILSVVTPILTSFMNLLSDVITKVGMFFSALSGKSTFTKAIAVQEDYAASLSDTADATKKVTDYSTSLDEINKASDNTDSKSNKGNVKPSEMFEEVEIPNVFQNIAKKLKKQFSPILAQFQKFGERIKKSTSTWFSDLDWGPLSTSIEGLMPNLESLIAIILDDLGWAYESVLLPLSKWAIEELAPASVDLLTKSFELLTVVLEKLKPVVENLRENVLVPFGEAVGQVAVDILRMLEGLLEFLIGVFTGDWDRAFGGLKTIVVSFGSIVDSTLGFIKKLITHFDTFLQKVFVVDWTKTFGLAGDGLERFFKNVKNIWSGFKQVLYGTIDFISGVFTGNWKRAWQGVKTVFKGIFDSLVAVAKIPINFIIGLINGLIRSVVNGLNSTIKAMNKLSFKFPDWLKHVPGVGSLAGKKFGFDIKTISIPPIPYLATGAVIPPNAPFMAMLGDQKHGTNIEAPLDTIKQAVAEVIGSARSGGGTYNVNAKVRQRTLFEVVIEEAKLVQRNTGLNPFELA